MLRILKWGAASCALLGAMAASAPAAADPPIAIGEGWLTFSWDNAPGVYNTDGAFTFSGPAIVKITDCCIDGDRFKVFDNGVSLGLTSVPANDGYDGGYNPDSLYADPKISHGTFTVGAGAHAIDIYITQTATGTASGSGDIEIVSAPEPASIMLMACGVGGLLIRRRRRA